MNVTEASALLAIGIMLCSLLCVFAALRNGGMVLQKTVPMLICQFYILLTAMVQLTSAQGGLFAQIIGFVTFALGVAPIVIKKSVFKGRVIVLC